MGRSAQNADKDVAEEVETARFQQQWMKFQPLSWEVTEDLVHGDICNYLKYVDSYRYLIWATPQIAHSTLVGLLQHIGNTFAFMLQSRLNSVEEWSEVGTSFTEKSGDVALRTRIVNGQVWLWLYLAGYSVPQPKFLSKRTRNSLEISLSDFNVESRQIALLVSDRGYKGKGKNVTAGLSSLFGGGLSQNGTVLA
ncbi:hypothetical protein CcaCcLH18_12139 [Colletotrichum camelliae]|nr:hypothetical protein CcaCcLH18_12139 [Colletotrichum camelliae]